MSKSKVGLPTKHKAMLDTLTNLPSTTKWPYHYFMKTLPTKSGFTTVEQIDSTLKYLSGSNMSDYRPSPNDYIHATSVLTHLDPINLKYVLDNIPMFYALLLKDAAAKEITDRHINNAFYKLFTVNLRLKYLNLPYSLPDKLSKSQRNLVINLEDAFKAHYSNNQHKYNVIYMDEADHISDASVNAFYNLASNPSNQK
mgnify:CR=1 FL=1